MEVNNSFLDSSSSQGSSEQNKLVGFNDELMAIIEQLTGQSSNLQVVSIVGMGGIGKTTLAQRIYNDRYVVYDFDIRVWITVSQVQDDRQILLKILDCVSSFDTDQEIKNKSKEELELLVYQSLLDKRFLIVMDDMWCPDIWFYVKGLLHRNKKGSRILLTTRDKDLAKCASPDDSVPHCLNLLNVNESWILLKGKVFGKENCPPELEKIGKMVAEKCQGLPLAIVVVAGLLSKKSKSINGWKIVLENLSSLLFANAEKCLDILALSYNHLPRHLKDCFLYFGLFPEDMEIPVGKLIKLWIAEEYFEERQDKSLEEMAEESLKDLIDRSLVLMGKQSFDGKVKTCSMHDLIRELCLRESRKENFLYVVNNQHKEVSPEDIKVSFRLSFHSKKWEFIQEFLDNGNLNVTHSILCFGKSYDLLHKFLSCGPKVSHMKLLKILDISLVSFTCFPIEIVQLTQLKNVAIRTSSDVPVSVSNLQHLQTMVVHKTSSSTLFLPTTIWNMSQLRHLHFGSGYIVDPAKPRSDIDENSYLRNLQAISGLSPSSCTEGVFRRMPQLKKLGIRYYDSNKGQPSILRNLVHLSKLEELKFQFEGKVTLDRMTPPNLQLPYTFRHQLKKLTLFKSCLPWKSMTQLSRSLPNLEVLKLKQNAFVGTIWELDKERFLQLKFLLLEAINLKQWNATRDHFPRLECLVIRYCYDLEELPYEIGEVPTLQTIELDPCSKSAVDSAKQILYEQQGMGNDDLNVLIHSTIRTKTFYAHQTRRPPAK